MTRKRSSPMGLELYLPVLLAFIMLPLLAQAAPLQDYTEIQQYTEGCYYNYNHYNEGDRIMTNEPCLNCTCHNKMLMCYLRVCPFTKPIGHDCIVEKREDQCCPIITCPEVPVDVAHATPEHGTELSFPEKFGCSIEGKFYLEGAQVPSNPNKPCELCYCIKNRTSCLMQECTLHIDGCTPIYNKGSCCPVRYNCDHENDVLELEDHSSTTEAATTTTTERPTTGFIISSTATATVSTDCSHNGEVYADGARIPGETACENCYCMRGDIVCAVQECHMPMIDDNGKLCQPLPAAEGECCPSNYVCKDGIATTQIIETTTLPYSGIEEEAKITTAPAVKDLHSAIPEEDFELQAHIDDVQAATRAPSAKGETEDESAEDAIASIPATTESHIKQEDADQDSVTKYLDNADVPTTHSTDIERVEGEESVTIAPTLSDELSTSSTELIDDDTTTETSSKTDAEYPAPGAEETTTKIPTTVPELSKMSTVSTDVGKEYATTTTSAIDKTEIGDSVTEISEATTEKISKGTSESTDEVKPIADDQYVTHVPIASEDVTEVNEKDDKPIESDEYVTESHKYSTEAYITSEEEQISTESATKSTLDTANYTVKEKPSAGEQDEPTTEVPDKISEKEEDEISEKETAELSTKAPINIEEQESLSAKPEEEKNYVTEESSIATTEATKKDAFEEEDLSTEEPKVERKYEDVEKEQEADTTVRPTTSDDSEKSTESIGEKETVHSTETSTKPDDDEKITKVPILTGVEHISATAAPEIEEEKEEEESSTDKVPTKPPIDIDSVTTSDETEGSSEGLEDFEPIADDKQPLNVTSGVPVKPKDASTTIQPGFDDEIGSGDYATEVIPDKQSEMSTIGPITDNSQEQEEENATTKPITLTKEKPIVQDTSTELSEESTESEEDKTLFDLTTVHPSKSAEEAGLDDEQLEMTTIRPSFEGIPSSADDTSEEISDEEMEAVTKIPSGDELTTTSVKTEKEISPEDQIDTTTVTTSFDEKVPTTEQFPKESTKSENITTQNPIEEKVQDASTTEKVDIVTEGEEHDHRDLPENGDHEDKGQTEITESPTPVTEDISSFTTSKTTTQADISTEPGAKIEEEEKVESTKMPSLDVEEGVPTSTIKTFTEPNRLEEMPDMQLPSHIPGEGDCLVEKKTYQNNSIVPTSNECELVCKCVSSIVICDHVKCDVRENIETCILDAASTNKCCPSYICDTDTLPPKTEDSSESIEEAKDEKVPHEVSTRPKSEDTDMPKITTMKPISDAASPGVSIPEIEMPVAITEEPMSHVKSEDEIEHQSTKSPSVDEKKDILTRGDFSTTPAAVIEDSVVTQSIAPVETSERGDISSMYLPVEEIQKEAEPEHPSSQDQPEKEFEKTTLPHEYIESATDSTLHVPSKETQMYTTTVIPTDDVYLTVKPLEEDEKTETETPSSDKSFEEPEIVPISTTSEKPIEPETQTAKAVSPATTKEPQLILPIESFKDKQPVHEPEAIHPIASTLAPSIDEIGAETPTPPGETQTEIEAASTTPGKDIEFSTISTEFEDKEYSTKEYSKDISDSTTTIAPSKSQGTEEDTASTTEQPSDKIEDNSIIAEILDEKLESTSTTATITEGYKEGVKPIQEGLYEQEMEHGTIAPKSSDDAPMEQTTTAVDYNLENTVSPISYDKHKKLPEESTAQDTTSAEPIGETTERNQPETQTDIASVSLPSEEYDENDKKEGQQTTTVSTPDEKTLGSDIETEKPTDLETNIDHSSTAPSMDGDVSTPAASTVDSIEQQTESAVEVGSTETEETTDATIEKITKPTESEESVTKSPTALDKYEPEEDIDHSTAGTTAADESTSEIIPFDKDMIPVKEDKIVSDTEADKLHELTTSAPGRETEAQNTPVPVKKPSLDLSLEASGEPIESEEEISTKPNLIDHIAEFVTQRIEEAPSKSTITPITDKEEKETSGEEGEEVDMVESDTDKPREPNIDQQNRIFDSTEHEVSSDKIPGVDMDSFTTKAPTSDTESTTNAAIAEEDIYDHNTEKQSQEDIVPSVTESPTSVKTIDDITAQQPEGDEDIISEHISTENPKKDVLAVTEISAEETEIENMVPVTKTPMTSAPEYENENANAPEVPTATENVTDKLIEGDIMDATIAPVTGDEIETVTAVYPKEESIEDTTKSEEIAHITELPGKEDDEHLTMKTPSSLDEIQNVTSEHPTDFEGIDTVTVKETVDEEDISTVVPPISSTDKDDTITQEKSEEPKTIEITTAALPTDEVTEITTSHIPTDHTEQHTEEVSENDIDAVSTTNKPVEDIEMTTSRPKEQIEDASGVTKVSETLEMEVTTVKASDLVDDISDITITQMPSTEVKKDSEEEEEEEVDQATQVPTNLEHESSDRVTELPTADTQHEEVSNKDITEMPMVADISTVKLPDMPQTTELPAKGVETERDETHEKTTNVSLLTEVSTDKISEEVTELPTKDEESHEEDTELSVITTVSSTNLPKLAESVTELPTKDVESEEETVHEKTTELSMTSHTSYDELPEHGTESPATEKETGKTVTELPVVDEVSTIKLSEQDREPPTRDTDSEDEKLHEPVTELPVNADISTENLHQHKTELPTKDIESEKESHEQSTKLPTEAEITTDALSEHVTELPIQAHEKDKEVSTVTEEVISHDESTISSEKLPEHTTELPSKTIESEADTYESADKLPEHITKSPSKDGESDEQSYDESSDTPFASEPTKSDESGEESHEKATELPIMVTEAFTYGQTVEQKTESAPSKEKPVQGTSTEAAEDISAAKLHPGTTTHPLFSHHTTSPSIDSRIDDTTLHPSTPISTKEQETSTTPTTTTVSTTTSEPVTTSAPHYQPQPPVYGQPPQYGPTQYEDEYTDEDEGEIFGPGTCRYGGKLYVSAQQIPRDDPCDFCFCFRSDIICLQQSCPPPIAGCHEEPISGFCCPRYECPVSMATVLNITTSTTTTSTTLPPHFLHHSYGNNAQRNGCFINGRSYRVGEKIESTSGPCINCTCGGDGKMKCDPQACVPEPTMQQVMAVVAAGRKR